jgi:hypothetical protein
LKIWDWPLDRAGYEESGNVDQAVKPPRRLHQFGVMALDLPLLPERRTTRVSAN